MVGIPVAGSGWAGNLKGFSGDIPILKISVMEPQPPFHGKKTILFKSEFVLRKVEVCSQQGYSTPSQILIIRYKIPCLYGH